MELLVCRGGSLGVERFKCCATRAEDPDVSANQQVLVGSLCTKQLTQKTTLHEYLYIHTSAKDSRQGCEKNAVFS